VVKSCIHLKFRKFRKHQKGHEDGRRDAVPILWGQAEGVGAVQPAEENAPG